MSTQPQQKRQATHPVRTRRRTEAEARQKRYDTIATDAMRHERQGRKARDHELDTVLYGYDARGYATRKPVTR